MWTRESFKRITPNCAELACNEECDHTSAHCGRMAEVIERYNKDVMLNWIGKNNAETNN